MDEQTQKIIAEQMKKLPKDVIEAIISVDYKTKLQEITKRQRLLIDQAGKLEMEVTLVMIGLEPLADFVANLQKELGLNTIRAKEVAMDVSENIFKPIRESLYKMNMEPANNSEVLDGQGQTNTGEKLPVTKFTNSSAINLNRDQILNEIENPIPNHPPSNSIEQSKISTEVEIRPIQELKTIPGQGVMDIPANIVEAKLTGTVVTKPEVINAKPENKLPEITKKNYALDPYREPIN